MKMHFQQTPKISCAEVTAFRGVDFSCPEAQMALDRAADMANMYVDSMGQIQKRTGYQKLLQGQERINGIFCYTYHDGAREQNQYFVHVGTSLYFASITADAMTLGARITDGMDDKKSRSFHFGGALYLLGAGYYKIMWDAGYKLFQIGRVCKAEMDTTSNCVFITQMPSEDTSFSGKRAAFINAECRLKEIEFVKKHYGIMTGVKLYVAPSSLVGKVRVESVHYLDGNDIEHTLAPEHYKVGYDAYGLYVLFARNDLSLDANFYCAPHVVISYNGFAYTPANIINRSPVSLSAMDDALPESEKYDGTLLEAYNLAAPHRSVEFYIPKAGRGGAVRLSLEPTRGNYGAVMRIFIDGALLQKYTVFRNKRSEAQVFCYKASYVEMETALLPDTDCVVRVEYVLQPDGAQTATHNIDACSVFGIFGGQNDTRVFLAGNPRHPACDYASGLYDATYFSDSTYTQVGADQSAIVGYHKISGYQVILKDGTHHDATQYLRAYTTDAELNPYFTVKQGAQGVGACSASSFKSCRDHMLFASTEGVYEIKATNVDAQTNLKCLSEAVNTCMLQEKLSEAVCAVADGKYYLAVSDTMYILDVERQMQWYVYRDLPEITCIYASGEQFIFGASDGGVYRFMPQSQENAYYDNVSADGTLTDAKAIRAYWDIPVSTLGSGYKRKSIEDLCVYLAPQNKTSLRVYYTNEFFKEALRHGEKIARFDFETLDFSDFEFLASDFPVCINTRAKAKRVRVFGARLENAQPGEGLTITGFALKYRMNKAIK